MARLGFALHIKYGFFIHYLANDLAHLAQTEHFWPANVDLLTAIQTQGLANSDHSIRHMGGVETKTIRSLQNDWISVHYCLYQTWNQHCAPLTGTIDKKEAQHNHVHERGIVFRQHFGTELCAQVKTEVSF